jgi:hypothetical protein
MIRRLCRRYIKTAEELPHFQARAFLSRERLNLDVFSEMIKTTQ